MGKGKPLNIAASVRDRLLALAKKQGEDFNFVLTRYAVERLVYRLSESVHRDRFVLKGATLFQVWGVSAHRATKDVDLLGRGENTPGQLVKIFREVLDAEVEPDGLTFMASTLKAEPISAEAEYSGVRVTVTAKLGTAKIACQADVGFGDAATPTPRLTTLPVMLDFPAPRIRAYAKETVVAEKFHAMVHLGLLNSRMKDYFDLWLMANSFEFDGAALTNAIKATFRRRRTPVPVEPPEGLSDEFVNEKAKQAQWTAFVRRVAKEHQDAKLDDVVARLVTFLMPIAKGKVADSGAGWRWNPKQGWLR